MKTETSRLIITGLLTIVFSMLIGISASSSRSRIASTVVASDVKLTEGRVITLAKDPKQLNEIKSVRQEIANQPMVVESSDDIMTVEVVIEEEPVVAGEVDVVVPDTNLPLANQVVEFAKQFVGNPYVYGGTSLTNGADCSGFVQSVLANFGISVNRSAYDQLYNGVPVPINNMQPGDIVLYGYNGVVSHASLYIGNNQIVHAMNSDSGIVITSATIMPIVAVRRVL